MATLHVMQGTWYSNGVAVTVSGDTCAQKGQPPQQLIPVERTLAGKKVITVARTLNGEEIIVDPHATTSEQIVWLNQRGEHVRIWMRG